MVHNGLMNSKTALTALSQLVESVGRPEAIRLLVVEGLSVSLAEKLVSGRYPSTVRPLVASAIERVARGQAKASAS